MIPQNIDDIHTMALFVDELSNDVIVRFGPIEVLFDAPTVDDVAQQIEIIARVISQEIV